MRKNKEIIALAERIIELAGFDKTQVLRVQVEADGEVEVDLIVLDENGKRTKPTIITTVKAGDE